MNDNTSNTPDNASRPGTPRNRDRNGRFIKRRKDNGESKSVTELAVETLIKDALDNGSDVTVEVREIKPRRSGNKKKVDYGEAARSIRFYQVRSIAGTHKFGLFYADGVKWDDPMRSAKDLVKHWFGEGGYEARHANAALQFDSAREAKDFRRKHFKLPAGFNAQEINYEERNAAKRTLTEIIGRRGKRPSHTTSKKNPAKPRKPLRDDLVKLHEIAKAGPTPLA